MSDRKRKLDVFSGDASATQNGHALVSPLTGRPYSQRYHDILSKRKGELPSLLPEIHLPFPMAIYTSVVDELLMPVSIADHSSLFNVQACLYGRHATTL